MSLTPFVQYVLLLASFFGVLYAPFHFLDRYASEEGKARVRAALKTGREGISIKPLRTLMVAVFGEKHLTARCLGISSVMSLVFTVLLLGVVGTYVDLPNYMEKREEQLKLANGYLDQALHMLLDANDQLEAALKKNGDSLQSKQVLDDLQQQRKNIEKQMGYQVATREQVLIWMLASLLLSMNIVCDYIALWKTRFILRSVDRSPSTTVTVAYLCLDLLTSVAIWTVVGGLFVLFHQATFLQMMSEDSIMLSASAIVSLGATMATSVWIYAFIVGCVISRALRWSVSQSIARTASVIDSYEHPFKILGILGSTAVVVGTVAVFGVIRLWR